MRHSVVIPSLELIARFDADDDGAVELYEFNTHDPVDPTRLTKEQRKTVLLAVALELGKVGKVVDVDTVRNRWPN
jgi:hypothetical protein